jgi:hypothetical protein
MNFPPKYIITFALLFVAMGAWQVFLIQRDDKMFSAYKNRQQQICEQIKSFSPDCHIE